MTLKKYLSQFTKEQLIGQIIELNKKYKEVRSYYEFSSNPDSKKQQENFKNKIYKSFYPRGLFNGNGPYLKEARQTVNDFKKLSPLPDALADVMMYYVECAVKFTSDFGDINEPFYSSAENMFYDTCLFIAENNLKPQFQQRCEKIIHDTEDFGWGFHDTLKEYYDELLQKK